MTRFSPPTRPLILLVEDEPLVRETNIDVLQEAGFRVLEARDADEAFGLLRHRPDVEVVLTDVDMPGSIDGFEFARLAAQGWPDVRVVVMSGKTTPGPGDLPQEAVFLSKPFRPESLTALLRRLADRTGLNKQAGDGEDQAGTRL
jgi:two-component system, response regulator PdtaR